MAKGAKISATKAQKTKTVAKGLSKKTPLKTAVKSASSKAASSKAASKSSNKASKTKAALSKGAVSVKSTAPLKSIAKSASIAKAGAASPKASSGGPSLGKVSSKAPATKPSAGKGGARLQVVPRGIAVKPGKADIQGAAAAEAASEATSEAETAPSLLVRAPEKSGKPEKKAKAAVDPKGERKTRKAAKSLALALDKLADLGAQWNALYERSKELEAIPYKMSNSYEARTAIMHKVLGWGYVLSSQNDRLEVLFKDGIKMLISNYKG